jgi:hypothetical protein
MEHLECNRELKLRLALLRRPDLLRVGKFRAPSQV